MRVSKWRTVYVAPDPVVASEQRGNSLHYFEYFYLNSTARI